MSIFEMFEYIRRTNADFYTANPLEQMSETELLQLAKEAGMTLEELHEHINKPHVEMTCPIKLLGDRILDELLPPCSF